MSVAARRFRIAFSFAGEKRNFVAATAVLVAQKFGPDAILYDEYHEAEFARPDLRTHLSVLYRDRSDLIVPVLCADYDEKRWTGWEWMYICDLLTKTDRHRVMPCRFDFATVEGLSMGTGFVELDHKTPEQLAHLILERLAINEGLSRDTYLPASPPAVDTEGTKENPSAILKMLVEGFAPVRAAMAGRLQITPPRAEIPAASHLFGREDDLTKLLELLRSHAQLAITGPGGLGKTALCAELVRRAEAEPWGKALTAGGLYLHDFYKAPSLAAFVSSILAQAGLACENPSWQPAMASLALRQPGVMLYIEGAEKLAAVDALLEFLDSPTRLILTTRDPRQAERLTEYPLSPLEFSDAAEALHHYAKRKPRPKHAGPWPYGPEAPGWALLARDLGGQPLACRLAGELCAAHTLDPAALHNQLGTQGLQRLVHGADSKHNLAILFRQSALAVQEMSPGSPSPALTAWHCLTLGGTSPVPFSILQAFGVADQRDLEPLLQLGLAWSTRAAAEEDGAEEPAYALSHALLGEWAGAGLEAFGRPPALLLESAMRWGGGFLNRVNHHARVPGGPARYLAVAPVAEGLLREVEALPDLPPDALYSFYYLAGQMHELHARHLAAEAVYRRGLEKMEQTAGAGAPATGAALNNLAGLLHTTNRLAEAEPLMRRALAINEAFFGKEHPSVATRLNNLAQLLKATNRLAEAERLMRRTLAIDEASFGKEHSEVAIDLNNLAALLLETNRPAEAEPPMRRVVEIFEKSLGKAHPSVAVSLNNLAELLRTTNRLAEAEPLYRRALAIQEASFGKEHPNVAADLNNLALLLRATRRLTEAEPLMRRALQILVAFTTATGHLHPQLMAAADNYAALLEESGDTQEQAVAKVVAILAPVSDKLRGGQEN